MDLTHVIKISRTSKGLAQSQLHYVDKILEKINDDDFDMAISIYTSQHLSKNKIKNVFQVQYSIIIGSLMYLISYARLDRAYTVGELIRFTNNPGGGRQKRTIRILRYLTYTHSCGMYNARHPIVIGIYIDANLIYDIIDSQCTSRFVFILEYATILWKSSKQTVIAKSTIKSDFIALDKCSEEIEWLCNFLQDISRWTKNVLANCIHYDS